MTTDKKVHGKSSARMYPGAWPNAKHTFCLLLAISLVGHFTFESPLWGLGHYITREKAKWFSPILLELTPLQLARYDGRDTNKPIYIGIDGEVFDVSSSRRMYGPGSTYNCFAGKDAARAFVTGCFDTHLTHDLRGLTREELASLDAWKSFFRSHQKYRKVGNILNPSIDLNQPLPAPCKPLQAGQQESSSPPPIVGGT